MGTNLYVGNLSYNVTSSDLEALFPWLDWAYGEVKQGRD